MSLPLAVALLLWGASGAKARPQYALKEGKACLYCHISASPGALDPMTKALQATTRNSRGLYYAAHNHTFDGYVERAVMGVSAPPVFHFAWKETLTDAPRRIGVGDLKDDGGTRFVTLNEKPGDKSASVLTIKRWDGKVFATEFTAEDPSPPDQLAVGRFAGPGGPVLVLTSRSVWYWNGKAYTHRSFASAADLLGGTRLKDGSERVLIANSPTDVKAYKIDPAGQGAGLLGNAIPAPESSQLIWGDMHASPDFFDKMGMPPTLAMGGLIGLWDVRKFGKMFLYQAKINQDIDVQNDPSNPNKPKFVLKSQSWNVAFLDTAAPAAGAPNGGQLYNTPTLAGAVYDIAIANPKDGKQAGLLILTSDSPDGKGRSLYFFPLD